MENIDIKNFLTSAGYLHRCEQCGRCSSACPITGENGFNIRQIIRYVEVSQVNQLIEGLVPYSCLVCRRCEEACPNNVNILGLIRAMRYHIPNELTPAVPCIEVCPAKIDIPGFIRMVAKGKEHKALELVLQRVPIPGILGRVCGRPCESKCRRSYVDSPVSICDLKRYVSSLQHVDDILKKAYTSGKNTKKRVLIIGSGPAGLTVAYYLRRKGHFVTMMEEREKAGGMLRYGIPSYRLPKSTLDTEIDRIINMGVDLKTSTRLVDFLNLGLVRNDFDAFFIATGLQTSRALFENSDFIGEVTYGLDFLMNVNSSHLENVGNNVLVLGGGNVAVDAARSAIRLGANSVTLACLENREDMLADPLEVGMALDEGVKIINSWGINNLLGDSTLDSVELINCESVFDKYASFNPKFGTKKMVLDTDHAIIAIGQSSDKQSIGELLSILGDDMEIEEGVLSIDSKNKVLGSKNIFAGGDIVENYGSVVGAVASGYNTAVSIDRFLGGSGVFLSHDKSYDALDLSEVVSIAKPSYSERQETKILPKGERIKCFSEVDCGLDQSQASIEATRCLRCDLEYYLACSS